MENLNFDNGIIQISLINNYTKDVEIIFNVQMEYPFKPPSITLSNTIIEKFKSIHIDGKKKNPFHGWNNSYNKWLNDSTKNVDIGIIQLAWVFTIIRFPKLIRYWSECPDTVGCLCCESILCGNNWSPGYCLYDICGEYLLRKTFFIYTSVLMQKNMRNILRLLFNNERWVLCDDIILHILSFCNSKHLINQQILLRL